jgi:cytochrome P450 family 619
MNIAPSSDSQLNRFLQWTKTYGPIFSLKIGHGTIVILNSAYYATQLMTARSLNYSDRPTLRTLHQLIFGGDHTMFMNADSRWNLRRKLYSQLMNASKCDVEHLVLVEAEIAQALKDLFVEPAGLVYHSGRLSNSIIMSLGENPGAGMVQNGKTGLNHRLAVFGIRTPKHDTPHYRLLQNIMRELVAIGDTGATLLADLIPAFMYFPECLWRHWKTRAKNLRRTMLDLYHPLVGRVMDRRSGTKMSGTTFLDGILDQQGSLRLTRNEMDVMCGNLIEGGTDTISTVLTFFQAMATYPHLQAEAQEQIDPVIGSERLPCWKDHDLLPNVAAIVKEVLRWRPHTPAGFPHPSRNGEPYQLIASKVTTS